MMLGNHHSAELYKDCVQCALIDFRGGVRLGGVTFEQGPFKFQLNSQVFCQHTRLTDCLLSRGTNVLVSQDYTFVCNKKSLSWVFICDNCVRCQFVFAVSDQVWVFICDNCVRC